MAISLFWFQLAILNFWWVCARYIAEFYILKLMVRDFGIDELYNKTPLDIDLKHQNYLVAWEEKKLDSKELEICGSHRWEKYDLRNIMPK